MAWKPKEGWNIALSQQDRKYCAALFEQLRKKLSEMAASRIAHMVVFKKIYHGLHYTEEQEAYIEKCLKAIRSVKA